MSLNTDTLKFSCTVPDCPGGEVCKRNAVNKFKPLIDEAAYSRKVVQTCLFRWWELTLCSRLWRPGAPRRNRAQPVAEPVEGIIIDAESEWRAIHNLFGKTFDFFSRPTVCSSLILTLQSFLCAHQNMGWIMKCLGFHRNASIDGGDDAEPNADAAGGPVHAKDRRQALLEFTSPKTSVVHRALRDGASLFDDEKKWAAYFSYNLKLWAMALIALAITDARILGNIKN